MTNDNDFSWPICDESNLPKPPTYYQLLYAQALNIAIALTGEKLNPQSGGDDIVGQILNKHKNITDRVYMYLRAQEVNN